MLLPVISQIETGIQTLPNRVYTQSGHTEPDNTIVDAFRSEFVSYCQRSMITLASFASRSSASLSGVQLLS
jgi:hypothetical protein